MNHPEHTTPSPSLGQTDFAPQPEASARQPEKRRRIRLSKQEKNAQYQRFVALLQRGCSPKVITSLLGLNDKRRAALYELAVERLMTFATSTEKRCVLHRSELPSPLQTALAKDGTEFLELSFEADGASGIFQAVSSKSLLGELETVGRQ